MGSRAVAFDGRAGQESRPGSPDAYVAEPFHSVSLLFTKVPFVIVGHHRGAGETISEETASRQSDYVVRQLSAPARQTME